MLAWEERRAGRTHDGFLPGDFLRLREAQHFEARDDLLPQIGSQSLRLTTAIRCHWHCRSLPGLELADFTREDLQSPRCILKGGEGRSDPLFVCATGGCAECSVDVCERVEDGEPFRGEGCVGARSRRGGGAGREGRREGRGSEWRPRESDGCLLGDVRGQSRKGEARKRQNEGGNLLVVGSSSGRGSTEHSSCFRGDCVSVSLVALRGAPWGQDLQCEVPDCVWTGESSESGREGSESEVVPRFQVWFQFVRVGLEACFAQGTVQVVRQAW